MSDTIEMVAMSEADLIRLRFELHPHEVEHVTVFTTSAGRTFAQNRGTRALGGVWVSPERDVTPR